MADRGRTPGEVRGEREPEPPAALRGAGGPLLGPVVRGGRSRLGERLGPDEVPSSGERVYTLPRRILVASFVVGEGGKSGIASRLTRSS